MATYIAHNAARDTVTVTLSKAEANALLGLAAEAEVLHTMDSRRRKAAQRAVDALSAATNTSARRAGFFD